MFFGVAPAVVKLARRSEYPQKCGPVTLTPLIHHKQTGACRNTQHTGVVATNGARWYGRGNKLDVVSYPNASTRLVQIEDVT